MITIVIRQRKKKRELELAAKRDNLEMKELGQVIAGKLFTNYQLLDKLIPYEQERMKVPSSSPAAS